MVVASDNALQVTELPFEVQGINISMFWHEKNHRGELHIWIRQMLVELCRNFVES
jgi:hypothetical protein